MLKPTLNVIHEDDAIVAVFKPFGMPSQRTAKGEEGVFELLKAQGSYAFLDMLQRLDRVAGGLMVFAKTSAAAKHFQQLREKGKSTKTYYTVVEQKPEPTEALLEHYLLKYHNPIRMRALDEPRKNAKKAILQYEWQREIAGRNLLKITPKTGRMHQIRVQLAKIGCPIVGDKKYGKTPFLADGSIALLSAYWTFAHPDNGEVLKLETDSRGHEIFSGFGY